MQNFWAHLLYYMSYIYLKTTKDIIMNRILLGLFAFSFCLASCGTGHNAGRHSLADHSQNAIDWAGSYAGRLPVAPDTDAEADVKITLYSNGGYALQSGLPGQQATVRIGTFSWTSDGSRITLKDSERGVAKLHFKVGENRLWLADKKGQALFNAQNGRYNFVKIDNPLVEKYWKLIELRGAPIDNKSGKEAFIIFKAQENRIHGNFGCNNFTGSYKLEEGNRINFSQMASTMMMCMNMETEQAFSEVLRMADNYYVDGNHLALNRARMAPLARFVAVYP